MLTFEKDVFGIIIKYQENPIIYYNSLVDIKGIDFSIQRRIKDNQWDLHLSGDPTRMNAYMLLKYGQQLAKDIENYRLKNDEYGKQI